MNVADLELCKELYELSGWGDTDHYYDADDFVDTKFHAELMSKNQNCPAYDLGYLVDKITAVSSIKFRLNKGKYIITAPNHYHFEGATLEDAACKFAIELIKSGELSNG